VTRPVRNKLSSVCQLICHAIKPVIVGGAPCENVIVCRHLLVFADFAARKQKIMQDVIIFFCSRRPCVRDGSSVVCERCKLGILCCVSFFVENNLLTVEENDKCLFLCPILQAQVAVEMISALIVYRNHDRSLVREEPMLSRSV